MKIQYQREIKFRAWLKNSGKMIDVDDIQFRDNNEYCIDNIKLQPKKKQPIIIINTKSVWRFEDEIVLMQFTGLKDKNGKEIYEGDILAPPKKEIKKINGDVDWVVVAPPEKNFEQMVIVIYNSKKARFEVSKSIGCNHKDLPTNLRRGFVVVGNIYENPELLKGE